MSNLHWWVLYASATAFLYLKPEYAMFNSYAGTVAASFAVLTTLRLVSYLTLYPEFFSPMKEIPTPNVSSRHWVLFLVHGLMPTGSTLADGEL